jgi:hypothetical protein
MVQIDVYVMVHNEEILLPYFLRHYGSFARRIIAFEDQSTDKSRHILESHPLVTVIEPERHGINETYWIGELWPMYESLSRGAADYVINTCVDEFIYHRDLPGLLEREKADGVQVIHCRGYTMIADAVPTTSGQIYDEIKRGLPDRWSSRWSIFDPAIHIRYTDGRHKIVETNAVKLDGTSGVKTLHYQYLGREYLEAHDRRNRLRFNVHDKVDKPYNPGARHNLPDGSRGAKLAWFDAHKHEAVNVVDYG